MAKQTASKAKAPAKKTAKAAKPNKKAAAYLANLSNIIGNVQNEMQNFIAEENIDTTMTGKERMRLIGAGVRNYGLIDKAFDVVRDNPDFVPQFLSPAELWDDMHDFEQVRQLVWVLEKFLQVANECMLVRGNKCFKDALAIYGNLKELAKRGVPGAQPLYEALLKFFHKRRPRGEEEPTIKEMEKDFHSLLHGTADGKIEIINERPQSQAGKRVLIDEVKRGRASVKETAGANIKE